MKALLTILLPVIGTLVSFSINAQSLEQEKDTSTTLIMDKFVHNFDTILEGDTIKTVFVLQNTGENDLYIRQIFPSCGCSVIDFKKTAISSGEKMEIQVVFDSHYKEGDIESTFQMFSNAGFHTLYLRGYVVKE